MSNYRYQYDKNVEDYQFIIQLSKISP